MLFKKRLIFLVIVILSFVVSSPFVASDSSDNFVADKHIYWLIAHIEKSTFNLNESISISGTLKRTNISNTRHNLSVINQTGYYGAPENLTINISILNSSSNNTYSLVSQILVNTSSGGGLMTKSAHYPSSVPLYAPLVESSYIVRVQYSDTSNNSKYESNILINVYSKTIDKVSIYSDKARYYPNDVVVIKGSAWRKASDSLVPVGNFSINGTVRRRSGSVESIVNTFSCTTDDSGFCSVNMTAPSTVAHYFIETNNFLASGAFNIVPFDISVYIKDNTGTSFKDILTTNEQAAVEVKVTKNGSTANGTFIFNGTITDSTGSVVVNITSTKLNDTNNFINRFQFTTGNLFNDGIYKANVDVFETGGSNASSSAFFQVRSWTMVLTKSSENSGFEYEYSSFPNRNISFEVYPKERANGTIIAILNNTHFNVSMLNSLRQTISTANISLNTSCGSQGCYTFYFTTPNVTGSYYVSVILNFSDVIQSVERTIKITDTTVAAFPSTKEGSLKELFSTTDFVYVGFTLKNMTSNANVTNVTLGLVVFENGTEMNYTRVGSWANIDSNNSILEWAFNESVGRVMMDAPKQGGSYSAKFFIDNNTGSALVPFIINPYDSCTVAKSAAGSVDSSSSWYVWQYKTTDTVYIELRLSRAENPDGRAPAQNQSSFSSQYGMGQACNVDTTKKQVISNATITIDKIVSAQSGAKQSLNTTATVCSADNDQGQYTCTIKPERKWDGGRHFVFFKILGPDGQTTDKAVSIFEARSFYIWAYADNYAWVQKPYSNITFNVRLYEAGSNWWSNWYSNSQSGGITGSVSVEKVNYMGDYGEWIWPPIDYKYNITGLNSSNITNGWGSFTIYHDRTSKGQWQTGTYSVTVKGTNDATGDTDYGEAWFSVRQWEAYSTPIESDTFNYKYAYHSKENVSLYVRIYNAGNYNDNGGASLGGNVTVSVKKITFYQSGGAKEVNSSVYRIYPINVNVSSPWNSASSSAYRGHILNISRTSGSWEGGWYNVILDINGSETGYGWFNVIPFNINTQPVNSNGTYLYTSTGTGGLIYFNVSTTKNKKDYYSWYSSGDYINTTIKDMVLRTWRSGTWESIEYNYPEDFNITPLSVNGTAIIVVNKSSNWDSGYYSGEIIMSDAEGSTASGYLWFSVQPFRLSANIVRYTVDTDGNATINLNVYQPDWNNNNLVYGNYSISSITETIWGGSGYSMATYSNYKPNASEWFNATTQLNITPNNNAWSLSNGGYRYVTIKVVDNAGGTSQTTSVSFRAVSVTVNIGNINNRYTITSIQNITLPITVTKSSSGAGAVGNISSVYEWSWPYQISYNFSVGSCNSATSGTCMVNSTPSGSGNGSVTQNVTLIAPSGGWSEGWHSLYLDFTSTTDRTQKVEAGYTWFQVTPPYTAYWYNENENASWNYYFGTADNVTFRLEVRNTTYGCGGSLVNVTKVEVASSSSNCWSDYCRKYNDYNFSIFNQTASWISANSISVSGSQLNCSERRGIRILNNGTNWERGNYYIRVTVNGSQGNSVLKTGYFYVKDTTPPNATITSPIYNSTLNGSLFFNATTSEAASCYASIVNYDSLVNWYCYGIRGVTNGSDNTSQNYRSCNDGGFNGSSYYYAYGSKWWWYGGVPGYSFNSGGTEHTFNFSTSLMTITQDYAIDMYCYDDDWNSVNRKVVFRVNVSNATSSGGGNGSSASTNSSINVTLDSPADGASITTGSQFNISIKVNSSVGVVNCTLYSNLSGSWHSNISANVSAEGAGSGPYTSLINFTATHSTAGSYKWGALCNFTNATSTWSSTNRTFFMNSSSASGNVTFAINQSEANGTLFTNSTATSYARLNYNISTSAVSNHNCSIFTNHSSSWASNGTIGIVNPAGNAFILNFTSNSSILWNVYCTNSTESGWGQNRTFSTVINNVTSSTPNLSVNLSAPAQNAVFSTTASSLNISLLANLSLALTGTSNCSLYSNYSGVWAANHTISTTSSVFNTSINISVNSTVLWNAYCQNESLNAWGSSNRTFGATVVNGSDSIASTLNVTLLLPANTASQAGNSTIGFWFNWSGSKTVSVNCSLYTNFTGSWSLNTTTNSILAVNSSWNLTHRVSSNSTFKWNVYCANASVNAWAPSNFTLLLS